MVYIVSTMLRKLHDVVVSDGVEFLGQSNDGVWKRLMLTPYDFDLDAITNEETLSIMKTIVFEHGGQEYDEKYPDGIPTSVHITMKDGGVFDSGLIMYPSGHARNESCNLEDILHAKFAMHGQIAMNDPSIIIDRCNNIAGLDCDSIQSIWNIELADRPVYKD